MSEAQVSPQMRLKLGVVTSALEQYLSNTIFPDLPASFSEGCASLFETYCG